MEDVTPAKSSQPKTSQGVECGSRVVLDIKGQGLHCSRGRMPGSCLSSVIWMLYIAVQQLTNSRSFSLFYRLQEARTIRKIVSMIDDQVFCSDKKGICEAGKATKDLLPATQLVVLGRKQFGKGRFFVRNSRLNRKVRVSYPPVIVSTTSELMAVIVPACERAKVATTM